MAEQCDVIIIGAGPVGALAALLLAKRGANVIMIDREPGIVPSPRALVYHRPVIKTLEEAGILEEVRSMGTPLKSGITWRKASDHSLLAAMDPNVLQSDDPLAGEHYATTLLGQHLFEQVVHRHLKATSCDTRFGYTFRSLEQVDNKVTVVATDSENKEHQFSASFVLGTDGAKSPVRHALEIPFEGFTHDINFMAVNFRYDKIFETGFDYVNFICDPNENVENSNFSLIIYTGTDDIWRCAYGDGSHFNEEELKARLPAKLKAMLPLSPDKGQYEILQAQPYRVHQRCASTYFKGRVLLAGDAAHINNPAGGFGLNAGLLDARVVADTLTKSLKLSDEAEIAKTLQEYTDIRREGFLGFTNPSSIEQMRRLWDASEEAETKLRTEFFASMKDPGFQREVWLGMNKMAVGIDGL